MANTHTSMVQVKLTKTEVEKRSASLAAKERELERTKANKKAAAKEHNGKIKLLEGDISKLAEAIDTGNEPREAQENLFAGNREDTDGVPFDGDDDAPAPKPKRTRKASKPKALEA